MKVSKKRIKHLISSLENTLEIVGKDDRVSEPYRRGYSFAIELCVIGIESEILKEVEQ